MQREPVTSRAIRKVGYKVSTREMEVEFASGKVYRYFEVPEFLHRGFMLAKSKGQYFTKRIHGRFRFEEVK